MENSTNQPTNPAETLNQTLQHPNNSHRGNFIIILGVIVLLLIVGGGAYFLGTQKNNTQPQQVITLSPTLQPTTTVTTPTSYPTISINQKNNWRTYNGENYTFMYPADWTLTGPSEFLETVQLMNPNKTVSIIISKGQYPYGFGGENTAITNKIAVKVDGKDIDETEIILNNKGAYVDFAVGEYNILYGTDYPSGSAQASLSDYNASKETIAEIISSFKLIN